ncbi:hypothetical protein [Psychroserpens luteolus]|uniref:hypothetical protein n=1 Tax=Psychroserpens luteolus TaxID=2855840 RepID=UPI001E41B60C|nr:hypothetical protein [Psychroserpens luteolus]MCD2260722.1 hypothetical protein [Psychroserpens luteolus]
MGEFLIELIAQFFAEFIPNLLKPIGAAIKWFVYLGKRKYNDILEERWNTILGFFGFMFLLFLLIYCII